MKKKLRKQKTESKWKQESFVCSVQLEILFFFCICSDLKVYFFLLLRSSSAALVQCLLQPFFFNIFCFYLVLSFIRGPLFYVIKFQCSCRSAFKRRFVCILLWFSSTNKCYWIWMRQRLQRKRMNSTRTLKKTRKKKTFQALNVYFGKRLKKNVPDASFQFKKNICFLFPYFCFRFLCWFFFFFVLVFCSSVRKMNAKHDRFERFILLFFPFVVRFCCCCSFHFLCAA